jgi:WbqC-like protein family
VAAKAVAIVQSCYIPWKGYFDLICGVDEFILYDDRQFTRRDWRNRNKIKTATGVQWLTIPVNVKGRYHQRIDETTVVDSSWAERHWQTLVHSYRAAPRFSEFAASIEELYLRAGAESHLSKINRLFLAGISELLGIETALSWSTDYEVEGNQSERLAALCRAAGADRYLSGPTARSYLDEDVFRRGGIEVVYADYDGYPEYEQLQPPFEHGVTILDLLFHVGAEAPSYMKRPANVA